MLRWRRPRPLLRLLALLGLLLVVLPGLGAPSAAQIVNNQPTAPVTSLVDCLRAGATLGQPSHASPAFVLSCFGGSWERPSYDYDTASGTGDAPRSFPALIRFGDSVPEAPSTFFAGPPWLGGPGQAVWATQGAVGPNPGVGSVFSVAYASGTNPAAPPSVRRSRVFLAAYVKRVTRFGPGGPGAIYVYDIPSGTTGLYATIPSVLPGPVQPGDGSQAGFPNGQPYTPTMGGLHLVDDDPAIIPYVGRTGLGGMAMDPSERWLVVLNLHTRTLVPIDTWAPTPTLGTPLPLNPAVAQCPGGAADFRPFALRYLPDTAGNAWAYVGYVCSGETRQLRSDLRAGVIRIAPAGASQTRVLDIPLAAYDAQRGNLAATRWEPWSGVLFSDYPGGTTRQQPLLTDLELAEDGSLLLAFRSRTADMGTTENWPVAFTFGQGDLLRAPPDGTGGWLAPSTGSEHFSGDTDFGLGGGTPIWVEVLTGGIAYVPGTHGGTYGGEVVSSGLMPFSNHSGGAFWFDVPTGGPTTAREELYHRTMGTHFKGSGVGDVELLCVWRALGNRVWRDLNANGRQDPGEPDIPNVRLQVLDGNGTVLATVTTGTITGAGDLWRVYVPPFRGFQVRIDPAMFGPGQPLAGLVPTVPDAAGVPDDQDSDATAAGVITIPPGPHRQIDLTYDIGLVSGANVRIAKSAPATVLPGGALTYTLTASNTGPGPAAGVQVVDTLPPGLTVQSATPPPSSASGSTLTWNLGTLAPGASTTLTLQVLVSASLADGTVLTNRAAIQTDTPGDDPGDNTSSTYTRVDRADVAITKASPTTFPVPAGQPVTYELDYRNLGPAPAANVEIRDVLPPQLRRATWSCASGCSASGSGDVVLALGTLPPGAGGRIIVTAIAETALPREAFVNVARITTTSPETTTTNNDAQLPGEAWTSDLLITKTADPVAVAGRSFAVTLVVRNQGPGPATAVEVVDVLPAGVTLVSASPAPSGSAGGAPRWDLGTLDADAERTITLTVAAAAELDGGTILTNRATVTGTSDRDPTNNESRATTVVRREVDLRVTKTGPVRVTAGDPITYTITLTNAGPSVARAVTLTDPLPPGLTVQSATPPPSSTSGSTLTWDVGDLAVDATVTISLTAQTDRAQATDRITVTNTVQGRDGGTDAPGGRGVAPDPTPDDATATWPTDVETTDLVITKTMPPFLVPGVVMEATLRVENRGPADARSVIVRDFLPRPITLVAADPPVTVVPARWDLGPLASGEVYTLTLRVRVPADTPRDTVLVNRATVDASTPDRDEATNVAEAPTIVRPSADVRIVKDGPTSPVRSLDEVTYTLRWTQGGPSVAEQVVIQDVLPEGFTLRRATPEPTHTAAGVLTWDLGTQPPDRTGTLTVVGTLRGDGVATDRRNVATITTTTDDPDPASNTATHTVRVTAPDLRVTKDNGVTVAQPGDRLTYRIRVTNAGQAAATGVQVTERPPPGVVVVDGDGWTPEADGVLTQRIPVLEPDQSVDLVFRLDLPERAPAGMVHVRNVVTVTDDGRAGPDPTPTDNTAMDQDPLIWGRVGDLIWFDRNRNGRPDPGEPGLAGIEVELVEPETGRVLDRQITTSTGGYGFDGLRPGRYQVRLSGTATTGPLAGFTVTTGAFPVGAITADQREDLDLDIGLYSPTAAVSLAYLQADRQADGRVRIRWGTLAEEQTARFVVMRSAHPTRAAAIVVGTQPSLGRRGGDYAVQDATAPPAAHGPLWYWLVEVEADGTEHVLGAVQVGAAPAAPGQVFLPLLRR